VGEALLILVYFAQQLVTSAGGPKMPAEEV